MSLTEPLAKTECGELNNSLIVHLVHLSAGCMLYTFALFMVYAVGSAGDDLYRGRSPTSLLSFLFLTTLG